MNRIDHRRVAAALALALLVSGGLAGCRGNATSDRAAGAWTRVAEALPWGKRDAGGVAVHAGRLWMLGGWTHLGGGRTGMHADAWSSSDGSRWTKHPAPGWSHGIYPMAASLQGRLWVMGGLKNSRRPDESLSNEVWSTADGQAWTRHLEHAPWEARLGAALTVHRGALWLTGGKVRHDGDPAHFRHDVWRSDDGLNWTRLTDAAPWSARSFHCSVSFLDRLWVVGGGDWDRREAHADVWSSADGRSWQGHAPPPWRGRIWHSCAVHDGRLWMIGGRRFSPWTRTLDEVWTTRDGESWVQEAASPRPGPRHGAYAGVLDATLWIMGGSADGHLYADAWRHTAGPRTP